MNNFSEHVSFIWSIAEILRGNYKQSEYGKVVLPFTVLRRLDCVLESTKQAVLDKAASLPKKADSAMAEIMLNQASGHNFHNTSRFTFQSLLDDPANIAANLNNIINGFNEDAREIFVEKFDLPIQIARLDKDDLLYLVVQKFAQTDLHPKVVDNTTMGYIFEELIRRFSEQSNETAGEHFTPREVIRLMVNLLFAEDSQALAKKGVIRKLYDPACGTGGMLSEAEKYLKELNPKAHLEVYGQELNAESFGICKSDMMIKGQNPKNIKYGNSFSEDGLPHESFDYMLSNPPFGVEWKKVEKQIKEEAGELGYDGRFGAGLPRVSDGSLLFVQHMIAKMSDLHTSTNVANAEARKEGDKEGRKEGNKNGKAKAKNTPPSRIAVVLNGSPLFTGSAGSGESEIRRWIIENDWLEAIIALPTDMFYNTGIATYIWIITNKKTPERRGKVQLINATELHTPMRKSLGSKRKQISDEQIKIITECFDLHESTGNSGANLTRTTAKDVGSAGNAGANSTRTTAKDGGITGNAGAIASKWFDNTDFGYSRITVERPLKLNFAVNEERIEKLKQAKPFAKLPEDNQRQIITAIKTIGEDWIYINRAEFIAELKTAFKANNCDIKGALLKTIWQALSEKDDTADICTDSKGKPEPDADLRDYENVPLKEDIETYFQREVIPHVPDAWIDHEKTKVGYEIPFNRHFYKYMPPRSLEEIDADLDKVSAEIMELLKEVHV